MASRSTWAGVEEGALPEALESSESSRGPTCQQQRRSVRRASAHRSSHLELLLGETPYLLHSTHSLIAFSKHITHRLLIALQLTLDATVITTDDPLTPTDDPLMTH